MARQSGPAMRVRSAAEESLGSERGRPAAPGLAAMTVGGRGGSELWRGQRHRKVALSAEEGWDAGAPGAGGWREAVPYACEEEGARGLREQALPNVWHQRRA